MMLHNFLSTFLTGVVFVGCLIHSFHGSCTQLSNCSGHGKCTRNGKCSCYDGWGSDSDISLVKSADCSLRVCPNGPAWADLVSYDDTAHKTAECSNAGKCNRQTGQCECFSGFAGRACQRRMCPNDCSGHGRCISKQIAARLDGALPVNRDTTYGERDRNASTTWDAQVEFVCVCDSSWEVGVGRDQRSDSEWFGRDCSLRHCPSANNPASANIDETVCWNASLPLNPLYPGLEGSLCQVDCAGQGMCDYKTGTCTCFPGFIGVDCGRRLNYEEPVVVQVVNNEADDDYIPYVVINDDDTPLTNVDPLGK